MRPFERIATPVRQRRIALAVMLASGFAGLGYQIVWTQQSALWVGHEAAAVLAIVTAFFGGLAVGALTLGRLIERSPRPERWYAALEVAIAAWGLGLALAMAPLAGAIAAMTGAEPHPLWQWAVAFGATLAALLPATAAMGATLPAMARIVEGVDGVGRGDGAERPIAGLYAANTLGAVAGVLAAAFWLVPTYGLLRTAAVCAACNIVCAVGAMALRTTAPPPASYRAASDRRALATLAATGLLGIGYEVLVARVIGQVTESTVYTFAILLTVYLLATALGAAAWARWAGTGEQVGSDGHGSRHGDRLLLALVATCLLGTASLFLADAVRSRAGQWFGAGMTSALAAEVVLAVAAFGLPALAMGALFSHLGTQAARHGASFARALGVNTLGAAAAPIAFGVVVVPAFGAKGALLLIVAGYAALVGRRAWLTPAGASIAVAGLAMAVLAPPLVFVDVPEGGRVVSYAEGVMASVSVVEDAGGVARLRIDNHQQEGSSASRYADARQALLPLLLHPAPRHALFLGLGTGVTASAAAADPGLEVDAVELLPEVVAASAFFRADAESSRLRTVSADARRFVRATPSRYNVIVADNFHPARSGSGALYTREHFQAVRARLGDDGLFCQWLPLHQLDLPTLRSIVATFLTVFPDGAAMLATNSLETPVLGLVGHGQATRFTLDTVRHRIATTTLPQRLTDVGLVDEFAVLGSFVAGAPALAAFAAGADVNTDDRPVVAYLAPRITYAPDSTPAQRLGELMQQFRIRPDDVLDAGAAASSQRLAAYWAARDRFLAAGRGVRVTADARAMLAQVREPLLAAIRISPDFRPAYDPLLSLATGLARTDPTAARSLLAELAQVQPDRPEASNAIAHLDAPPPRLPIGAGLRHELRHE